MPIKGVQDRASVGSRTHDISYNDYHISSVDSFCESLTAAADAAFPSTGETQYNNVAVLLMSWVEDDLNVQRELKELDEIFDDHYHFDTEKWPIESDNAHAMVARRILRFLAEKDAPGNLLIFYYGGHGGITDDRQCIWSSTREPGAPIVRWSALQSFFEEAASDVLILLDCCSAASSSVLPAKGVKEIIAACGFETWAPGVGPHSFTRSLISELEFLSTRGVFSAAMLHARVLERIKYWRPTLENGEDEPTEERKTPVHINLSSNVNRMSIRLAPRPVASHEVDRNTMGTGDPADWLGGNHPRVLVSIALADDQWLDKEDWLYWLRSIPAIIKYTYVEGVLRRGSTLLLRLMWTGVFLSSIASISLPSHTVSTKESKERQSLKDTFSRNLDRILLWAERNKLLLLAATSGDQTTVAYALQHNADTSFTDQHGRTALALAAINGDVAVVRMLLNASQLELDKKDQRGRTPLMLAAQYNKKDVVPLLMKSRTQINQTDIRGQTALLMAVEDLHYDVVKLLLKDGRANTEIEDNLGRTPRILASVLRDEQLVKLLDEHKPPDVHPLPRRKPIDSDNLEEPLPERKAGTGGRLMKVNGKWVRVTKETAGFPLRSRDENPKPKSQNEGTTDSVESA